MIMKNGNNNNSSNNTQLKYKLLTFEKKIIMILYLSLIKFENQQLMKCIHMKLNEILLNY